MRSRTLSVCSAMVCICVMVTAVATAAGQTDANVADRSGSEMTPVLDPTGKVWMDPPVWLPRDVEIKRCAAVAGGGEVGTAAAARTNKVKVYENILGRQVVGVSLGTYLTMMADDIAIAWVGGHPLDYYTIMVSGDRHGNGSGVGPYSIDVGLYTFCPGATLPGDPKPLIANTDCHFEFDDNAVYAVTCSIPSHIDVPLPSNFYLGVKFSRGECGVVIGAPPTLGFSADLYDYPGLPCYGWAGGYPKAAHASFYSEIAVRDECPPDEDCHAFVGYKNNNQAGTAYAPGYGVPFADYIRLGVPECNVIAYEVAIKGFGLFNFDLRTHLSNSDPTDGGVIAGTRGTFLSLDKRPKMARVQMVSPISLPPDLWIAFVSSSSIAGPVVTNREASLGTSEDFIAVHDGTRWVPENLGDLIYAAFDVTIVCEGSPPMGACCDMVLTENRVCVGGENDGNPCVTNTHCPNGQCVGESVCREVPEMNCGFPKLWRIGETCGAACYRGKNDGLDCTDDTDCKFCQYGEPPDYTYGDPCEGNEDCLLCDSGPYAGEGHHCAEDIDCGRCVDYPDESCLTAADCTDGDCDAGTCWLVGVCAGDCVGSFCEGGTNDGKACSRQVDCPGYSCAGGPDVGDPCDPDDPDDCPQSFCKRAECDDVFPHPCGQSACCAYDEDGEFRCSNRTENECYEHPPVDRPRLFGRGEYCNEDGFSCPWGACLAREGECTLARDRICNGGPHDGDVCEINRDCGVCVGGTNNGNPCNILLPQETQCPNGYCDGFCEHFAGCEDPWCCTTVCEEWDPYCCLTEWDWQCAANAFTLCETPPSNDHCWGLSAVEGAKLVIIPSSTESDSLHATEDPTDPGFCCHGGVDCPGGMCCHVGIEECYPSQFGLCVGVCMGGSDAGDPCEDDWNCEGGYCQNGERDGKPCDREASVDVGPGSQGYGTVWYKFVAPDTSAELLTCNSSNVPRVNDSVISVYTLADPDRGICENMDECSLSDPNCSDGSECVLDEQYACEHLLLIGCSDDVEYCSSNDANAKLCVTDLEIGQTYYVLVGAKIDLVPDSPYYERVAFNLEIYEDCILSQPPMPNDFCQDATPLAGEDVDVAFDLSGGEDYAPATFHCPGEPGCPVLQNDIWYTWTAPCSYHTKVTTCDLDLSPQDQSNTTLCVYDGCNCPPEFGTLIGECNFGTFDECGNSATVTFDAVEGNCYTIRLGGHLGATPEGVLKVNIECPDCPVGPVTFVDPPDGVIDARRPHPPDDSTPTAREGIRKIAVQGQEGLNIKDCWTFCETAEDGSANDIDYFVNNGGGAYDIHLVRSISTGEVTTLTYEDDDGNVYRGVFTSHPANTDYDGVSDAADVLAIIDYINGVDTP
ncbi:MAG: hypothetical protein WBE26_09975, partial [Phycisphaerae bacterium]